MISLYIHIPFCDVKCEYCNFYVITWEHVTEKLKSDYITWICKEIIHWSDKLIDRDIKSIYFWGWTPSSIWKEWILQILYSISCYFNLDDLTEISCELNPNPYEKTIDMIEQLPRLFPAARRRFSIGIQTFDDEILKQSWRGYFFNNLKWYLRQLRDIKQQNHVFNLDFIAFGRPGAKEIRNATRREFFEKLVRSHSFDSVSLYQLELFPGSKRHHLAHTQPTDPLLNHLVKPDDDTVMQEWEYLHDIILDAWYMRYEVSNYTLAGQDSIHNHVYWACEPYIGLWTAASGLVYTDQLIGWLESTAMRYTNTSNIVHYLAWDFVDNAKTQLLKESDLLYEKVMLGLRTKQWLRQRQEYKNVMVDDIEIRLSDYINDWLISEFNGWLKLTDAGMNVANRIISELLK